MLEYVPNRTVPLSSPLVSAASVSYTHLRGARGHMRLRHAQQGLGRCTQVVPPDFCARGCAYGAIRSYGGSRPLILLSLIHIFRAGQNLPDKEFRYLRTVIVTAAVYRGCNSDLRLR